VGTDPNADHQLWKPADPLKDWKKKNIIMIPLLAPVNIEWLLFSISMLLST